MIEINNLTKRFEKVMAVDRLSLRVPDGSVLGLVGSNGSGKSTLLRMLAGVFRADSGSITVNGRELFDDAAAKGECFFIPDFPFFYNNSTSCTRTGATTRMCAIAPFSRSAPRIRSSICPRACSGRRR